MQAQYCTVVSNGCLNYFESNSLTKFTNVLPFPLYPVRSNTLYVRLRALGIWTSLKDDADIDVSQHIKIKLDQLEPQVTGKAFEKTLAILKFPPSTVYENYAVCEFENTPFLALETVPLERLGVTILNSEDKQLELTTGIPTLVKLEISDMDTVNQFTITCESNSCDDVFPTNTLSDFKVSLPGEMNLTGWEVALQSVAFPTNLKVKVPTPYIEFETFIGDAAPEKTRFEIDVENMTSNEMFWEALDNGLKDNEHTKDVVAMGTEAISGFRQINVLDIGDKTVGVSWNKAFQQLFGERFQEGPWQVRSRQSVIFSSDVDIFRLKKSPVGYLFTDCIEENVVSNELHQLLQIIPIKESGSTWDTAMYEPQHLVFHPVKPQVIASIHFTLRTPDGRLFELETPSTQPMVFTLVFRPSKNPSSPLTVDTVAGTSGHSRCSLLSQDVCKL